MIRADMYYEGRPVYHFLSLLTTEEWGSRDKTENRIPLLYADALYKAKPHGGKKFHNRRFGGGIIFQTEPLELLEEVENKEKEVNNAKHESAVSG